MSETGHSNSRSISNELEEQIKEAISAGNIKIDTADGPVYLVAPKRQTNAALPLFEDPDNLLSPPLKRAAYSDRTAWIMAVLSDLAYLKFEEDDAEEKRLIATLGTAGFISVQPFNDSETGTQAFLAEHTDGFLVLAFRGTEKDRKDILTDLNARFYKTASGKSHRGFSLAYESIQKKVEGALDKLEDASAAPQLFITGHSLGGAVATIAAKELEKKFLTAACYTYGSPRVGNAEWSDGVKTPVYRVVNCADCVPMVPGGAVSEFLIGLLPDWPGFKWLKEITKNGFVGFQHAGDFRFLMDVDGTTKLKVGSSATWERLKYVVVGKIGSALLKIATTLRIKHAKSLASLFADHSIKNYHRKLKVIATDRN